MERGIQKSGFTLVELMVALIVASIVLAAVSTLAQATVAADDATDQMGREQAQVRQLTMHLTDLIRRANKVTSSSEGEFVLWHDNNADGWESGDELTRIRRGADLNGLEIVDWAIYEVCESVDIQYDAAAPNTRFIRVGFTVSENGQMTEYSINGQLRLAGN
jgi:prepilin-type N-terminal cleavage/methylation domain-containing protein